MKKLIYAIAAIFCAFLACTASASSLIITEGQGAKIAVTADGTTPFAYQWFKNGSAISGATSATYTLAPAAPTDSGTYTVVVSNSAGSATSDNAALTVNIRVIAPSNVKTTMTIQ
jgi:hypothetical protein